MDKMISKKIKKLKKIKNLNIHEAYELYDFFANGKYVEKNLDESKKYLPIIVTEFKKQSIKISSLNMINFRGIKDLKIEFNDKNIQVFIGNNGSGKTTILEAMYYSLSWLINKIVNKGGTGKPIDKLDISNDATNGYSSIITKINLLSDYNPMVELCQVHEGNSTNKKSYYLDFTKLGELYKLSCEFDEKFELPVLAYYGVMRSNDIHSRDVNIFNELSLNDSINRFDGYTDSLNGKADFKAFFRWYKRLDDLAKHEIVEEERHFTDKELISRLTLLAKEDINAKQLLKRLKLEKKVLLSSSNPSHVSKIKNTINKVISIFMNGYTNLKVELKPSLHLTIEKNKEKINILQLSQGEKSLLALILDVTRRLIVLNPHAEDPLACAGIILIDEIDLHLHPEWQRHIIKKLNKVFPNCQFFVSTHSPQVISEVEHDQIFILDKDNKDEYICIHPRQSYGLTSNDILDEIMKSTTRSVEVQNEIDFIFTLISEKKLEEAKCKIVEMEKKLKGEIPELLKAKFDIDLYGWNDE